MIIFRKKRTKVLLICAIALAIIITVCGIYLGTYYHADEEAIAAFGTADADIEEIGSGITVFGSRQSKAGFIFYPGGKVECSAYTPLMAACAQKGIFCVLVEMPFNLAVFDINAADGIPERFPDVKSWYIGGHSLGGSMAASYLGDNADVYDGLILLGSYSATDLTDSGIKALSVYGSEDEVLNADKYEANLSNLPDDFKEIVINGGCHSYFGMYGEQSGDGKADITNEEQIRYTADVISEFVYS